MKPLLIHNDNTYLLDTFQENGWHIEKFEPTFRNDIDLQIDDFIDRKMSAKEISAVFVKGSLTKNYLELLGLRFGLHIRLSYRHPSLQKLPIIFLCEESVDEICRICAYPEIIFADGVYITSESLDTIRVFFEAISSGTLTGCSSLAALTDRLNILPPANYLSHHSIANEWSILRWAKVLNVESTQLLPVENNIQKLLYYKYLRAKYPTEIEPDKASFSISGKGTILYIDDEWNKGWNVVFNGFFDISTDLKDNFHVLEYDFKDKSEEKIIESCIKKVNETDADIVILDLRLTDDDFNSERKTNQMIGYKVLEAIKKINPGIRVIIFTASNKAWNIIQLQNAGANGFILKESPELSLDKELTRQTIKNLGELITEQLKYQFQKDLFSKCDRAKEVLAKQFVQENEEYNTFIGHLKKQLEIVTSAISLINLKRKITIDIAFLAAYNFLELFKNYYLVYNKRDFRYYVGFDEMLLYQYGVNSNGEVDRFDEFLRTKYDPSWFTTMAFLFIEYFEVSRAPFSEVVKLDRLASKRNTYIHGDKKSFDSNELKLIIDIMLDACKNIRE